MPHRATGGTCLHFACHEGSEEAVRALIAAGADVNKATACESVTPLIIAAINGSEPVAQALIAAGADVNKTNKFGETPMRMAAKNGQEAVIRALIAAGAVEDQATKILRASDSYQNATTQLMERLGFSMTQL